MNIAASSNFFSGLVWFVRFSSYNHRCLMMIILFRFGWYLLDKFVYIVVVVVVEPKLESNQIEWMENVELYARIGCECMDGWLVVFLFCSSYFKHLHMDSIYYTTSIHIGFFGSKVCICVWASSSNEWMNGWLVDGLASGWLRLDFSSIPLLGLCFVWCVGFSLFLRMFDFFLIV